MNVIAVTGNMTADPELKTTPNGVPVCSFTVAVRRPNTKDKTDFINCVAWRSCAEFISNYFSKGQKIEIDGSLTSRKWEDKNGNKRTSFEITVSNAAFGESKKAETAAVSETAPEGFENTDDDLPF